jgi:RHS repeat-associated protein
MGGWWGFVRIVVCVVALVVPLVANARRLHHEVAGGAPFDPWDGRGRLTEVIRDTAVVQSSHYDAAGVRIVKREGASTTLYLAPDFEVRDGLATTYVKAGHASVAWVDEPAFATTFFPDVAPLEAVGAGAPAPDGVITAADAWLVTASKAGLVALPPPDAAKAKTADVDAMLASAARRMLGADATQTTYVSHDRLGSASLETNERGEAKARRWHGPYGEVRGATGAWAEARGFTGKERDEATGLADHGARYLDTRLGRWTAPDPLAVRELGGAELDVYGYVDGRVTLAVDPDGQAAHIGVGAFVGGVVGAAFELAHQAYARHFDGRALAVAAVGGAASGAMAAATGGASLAVQATVGGAVSGAVGSASRLAQGQKVTAGSVAIDVAAGAAGPAVAKIAAPVARATSTFVRVRTADVSTLPSTAFFWSGRTAGVGGEKVAANIAASRGGVTLEMLLEKRNIKMPAWDQSSRVSMDAWKTISRRYAEGVSGDVRAVVGEELRAGNVWENVELPRLSKNHSVTSIVQIDPATQVEHSIMTRSPSGEAR